MPIHFNDLDIVSEVEGLSSALIVPCIMCPAATVAVREKKPFLQLFRSLLKSAPLEHYIRALQSRLSEKGLNTNVFKSLLYHLCLCACGLQTDAKSCRNMRNSMKLR